MQSIGQVMLSCLGVFIVLDVKYSNCKMTLIYANRRKPLNLNKLSPISLLLGVSLTSSYCQKIVVQMGQEPMEATL